MISMTIQARALQGKIDRLEKDRKRVLESAGKKCLKINSDADATCQAINTAQESLRGAIRALGFVPDNGAQQAEQNSFPADAVSPSISNVSGGPGTSEPAPAPAVGASAADENGLTQEWPRAFEYIRRCYEGQLPPSEVGAGIAKWVKNLNKTGKECVMNIEDLTIGEAKQLASMFSTTAKPVHPMLGRRCLVRTYSAVAHIGDVVAANDMEVHLQNAIRLWKWGGGGLSLSVIASTGIKGGRFNKTGEVYLTNAIEIIPTTKAAEETYAKFIEA